MKARGAAQERGEMQDSKSSTWTLEWTDDHVLWHGTPHREPRWPATVATLAALVLFIALPDKLVYGPKWVVPILEAIAIVPLTFIGPRRHPSESMVWRGIAIALIALISAANMGSLILLVQHLLEHTKASGNQLIFSAILIWLTNVIVFGLWYWELDRGGPGKRSSGEYRAPDFLFPQMATPDVAPRGWWPSFLDYLYVSFTNASAFSPTDTMPLTEWAKMLMLVQSLASLLTVALVAARAVNILS